jgi:hypothetical protein
MKKPDDSIVDLTLIAKRAEDTREWLKENGRECFTEQKHIRGLNQEKIYWHYGYLAALTDVLRFLSKEVTDQTVADRAASSVADSADRYN